MRSLGAPEILIIALVILLLFGDLIRHSYW